MLFILYVIFILTSQNIYFANVKISNRCPYVLRLSCLFVVDTSQAAQTLFVIYVPFNRMYHDENVWKSL